MIYGIIGCIIIIGILVFKLLEKQKINTSELEKYKQLLQKETQAYQEMIQNVQKEGLEYFKYKEKREYEEEKLEECKKDLQAALDVYQNVVDNRLKEIDKQMEEQRQKREAELQSKFEAEEKLQKQKLLETINHYNDLIKDRENAAELGYTEMLEKLNYYKEQTDFAAQKFMGIESSLALYEKEKQEKLFYTIQLPEEYKDDIDFLLTTVASTVRHPDIINKLVWQEYVRPNLEDTFKRIEIKAESGIYKLTSLINGKCYIGKSANVKNRITDHFKSVIGISNIADQAVHHAIRNEGFWNWQIEVITYCDKGQLNELEKYYIEFFKGQEFGYNKNAGG